MLAIGQLRSPGFETRSLVSGQSNQSGGKAVAESFDLGKLSRSEKPSVENRVIDIIFNNMPTLDSTGKIINFEKGDIRSESELIKDLRMDSLGILNMIVDLESSFEISIPDAKSEEFLTVGNVVDYITTVVR